MSCPERRRPTGKETWEGEQGTGERGMGERSARLGARGPYLVRLRRHGVRSAEPPSINPARPLPPWTFGRGPQREGWLLHSSRRGTYWVSSPYTKC